MRIPLGKPVLAMLLVAMLTGGVVLLRPPQARPPAELWTFAQSHADLYRDLQAGRQQHEAVSVRLIPNNALNVRLISLLMADHAGSNLPDVVEIRQDALGRYLGPDADQIGLLPLNDFLARPPARWKAQLPSQRLAPYTKSGQIFGLPRDVHATTLSYRIDLFTEAGVDLESPTSGLDFVTWDDFRQRCLRFQSYWRTRGVTDRWALDLFAANADLLSALLLQRGVNLIDATGKVCLSEPVVADTLVFYAGLVAGSGRISADSVSAGRNVWTSDLSAGVVCGMITPDWRVPDLRTAAPALAGRWRMTPLPRFAAGDAPTTTWGGTMIAIPRRCRDPEASWRLIESLYLSDAGMDAQTRRLGILPANVAFWQSSPAVQQPDPYFGGQPILRLYATLAPDIPHQVITPDTAYATAALGYVLTQAVGALREGIDAEVLREQVAAWLAARQADVERQIAHGRLALPHDDRPAAIAQ